MKIFSGYLLAIVFFASTSALATDINKFASQPDREDTIILLADAHSDDEYKLKTPDLEGKWIAKAMQFGGHTYSTVLYIDEQITNNEFRGKFTITHLQSGMWAKQKAQIFYDEGIIEIQGEIVGTNSPDWSADNFKLKFDGSKLVGESVDDEGANAPRVVFKRISY